MLHRVALVKTDVSEKFSTSIVMVARIGELGTTLSLTSNRRTSALKRKNKQTPWPLVGKGTLPTERQPLVGET
jgi:hypothetical protein